jgi:SAM-dependent methyltransferase
LAAREAHDTLRGTAMSNSPGINDARTKIGNLTREAIERMNFSELVGLVNEPNTPSGGGKTVRRVLQQVRLDASSRVLEIGSNTGFTSIEIASWVPCPVVGVDINPRSIALARAKGSEHDLRNVTFTEADALSLPFPDGAFDLVFCSNTTSFILDRQRAITEYYRVLRPRGVLAAVPIYYREPPPNELRRRVEEAVGAEIPPRDIGYWRALFDHPEAPLIFEEEHAYVHQSPERIAGYVDRVMSQPLLAGYAPELRATMAARLRYFYDLFNENLRYARYAILLYRIGHPNRDPVLFESRPVT